MPILNFFQLKFLFAMEELTDLIIIYFCKCLSQSDPLRWQIHIQTCIPVL